MDGESINIKQARLQRLKELFPELFAESQLDWEKLKAAFGDAINFANERYVLNWAGKSDAFKILQQPTTATLKPAPEESVNFDTTENLFIEGENLEVLKVLQKAYYGKVKCIDIDPPYNTGSDSFIYPDKFSEKKEDYLKRIGDKDEEGYLMKEGLFRKNSKDSGHYHSNWLSMMYPRLFLAKNLLRDDGVIFVHIDDNEVHNLQMVMNEIFGEENFRGIVSRATGTRMGSGNKKISSEVDYILIYAKSEGFDFYGLKMTDSDLSIYDQEDERGKYLVRSLRRTGGENRREDRPTMYYPITAPDGTDIYPLAPDGWESRWICSKEKYTELQEEGFIEWKKVKKGNEEKWQVYQKHYLGEAIKQVSNNWTEIEGNKKATRDLNDLFDGRKLFDHPKPLDLLKKALQIGTTDADIILDFFAGSATTAHAVLDLNKQDNSNRKFILVQMPEPCAEDSEAFKAGYKTIADIAKERIRRVIKRIESNNKPPLPLLNQGGELDFGSPPILGGVAEGGGGMDLGFKVFKLSSSNFKIWRGAEIDSEEKLVEQLDAFTDPGKPGAEKANMLYELMLKAGYELTSKVEYITISSPPIIGGVAEGGGGNPDLKSSTTPTPPYQGGELISFYSINNNELIIALDAMNEKLIEQIISAKPQKVITLDSLFTGNDQLKTNTVLQMRDAGVDFKTI